MSTPSKYESVPAFPTRSTGKLAGDGNWLPDTIPGMTLRDWVAGQALAGMLVSGFQPNYVRQNNNTCDFDYGRAAYEIATKAMAWR